MFLSDKVLRSATRAAHTALFVAGSVSVNILGQRTAQMAEQPEHLSPAYAAPEPTMYALPLSEDRGAAALEQSLRRLSTTASLMMIVAHPDDEDGALLTYLARGRGVRATLFTLTRGEGGQNAMSADSYDALGIIRTNELLRASEFYGAKQMWGTEADFG